VKGCLTEFMYWLKPTIQFLLWFYSMLNKTSFLVAGFIFTSTQDGRTPGLWPIFSTAIPLGRDVAVAVFSLRP